eukprot:67457_1
MGACQSSQNISISQNTKVDKQNANKLKTYQYLINLGFDEILALNAVDVYGEDINQCIDYIQKEQTHKLSKYKVVAINNDQSASNNIQKSMSNKQIQISIQQFDETSPDRIDFEKFNVKAHYTKNETVGHVIQKVTDSLQQVFYPLKLRVTYIHRYSFVEKHLSQYMHDEWNKLMKQCITDFDYNDIIKKGLIINVGIMYEHKTNDQEKTCQFMNNKHSTNPMHCPIYNSMKIKYEYNQKNYHHVQNYQHIQNTMKQVKECKYNENCFSFKRLEEGGNKYSDLCHIEMYRHPPRLRNVKLQENMHSFILNTSYHQNAELPDPSDDDRTKYSYNENDGYLQALIQEVIKNGFKYDLCSKCEINEECKHTEYDILQIVDQKLSHQRHLMMGSPIKTRDKMLALILYTGCQCNYDLCLSQRNGDYSKWKWFDWCLYHGISDLWKRETSSYSVYSGLDSVQLDRAEITQGYFKTYVSASWNKNVASSFIRNKGMLMELDNITRKHYHYSCDVSWISKFPTEYEILFTRSVLGSTKLIWKVIDNKADIQTAIISLKGYYYNVWVTK